MLIMTIVFICLIVLALVEPALVLYAYRTGLRDGLAAGKDAESEGAGGRRFGRGDGVFGRRRGSQAGLKEREATEREKALLANIDAYDGTSKGQKEVKG